LKILKNNHIFYSAKIFKTVGYGKIVKIKKVDLPKNLTYRNFIKYFE